MSSAAVHRTGEWRAHSNFIDGAPTIAHRQSTAAFTDSAALHWPTTASGGAGQGELEFDTDHADFVTKEVSLFDRQHVRATPLSSAEDTANKERDYDDQTAAPAPSCWGRDGEGLGSKSAQEAPAPRAVHPNFFEQPQASQAFNKNKDKTQPTPEQDE